MKVELPMQPNTPKTSVRGCDIDIVDLLRSHGYGVVEGADEVRKKIKEIGNDGFSNQNYTTTTFTSCDGGSSSGCDGGGY